MSCVTAGDPQLAKLAGAIAKRVGRQRFQVWFHKSTKLDLKHDGLEIAVPNDFISDWIKRRFTGNIQEAAHEVLGCSLPVRFNVVPRLFEAGEDATEAEDPLAPLLADDPSPGRRREGDEDDGVVAGPRQVAVLDRRELPPGKLSEPAPFHNDVREGFVPRPRLRHDLENFLVGNNNRMAYECCAHVADVPGTQYNPLFVHGGVGLGKTHLLQGLCRRFAKKHPTKRWIYVTGEEFTNDFLVALKTNRVDAFRRKMRDVDLLVIDDVHFLGGKKATQEEFLHTFNAIEASGRQVVMASDNHPKMIAAFGESLINRFVSGMVVRIDPPNREMRSTLLKMLARRANIELSDEVIEWIATRVTQNVRELEGAVTRIAAHVRLSNRRPNVQLAQEALGDLDRQLTQPVRPDHIMNAICEHFALDMRDLMSGRRQRTISLARSVAMYLIRKTSKLSYPEIAMRMGKRNHSTVISACRRVELAIEKHEMLEWTSSVGDRQEEAGELVQRLEEAARAAG